MKACLGIVTLFAVAVALNGVTVMASCPWYRTDITILVDMKKCLGLEVQSSTVQPFLESFVKQLSTQLNQDENKGHRVRVGISTYGGRLNVKHSLDAAQTEDAINTAIKSLKYEPGMMTTNEALDVCAESKCYAVNGEEPNKRILIVLTGGNSDNKDEVAAAVKAYRALGISVFAVGIGKENDEKVLAALAEDASHIDDAGDKCSYYDLVKNLLLRIRSEQCGLETTTLGLTTTEKESPNVVTKATAPPKVQLLADIVFLIDSSRSLLESQFHQEIDFAKNVTERMAVGETGARFGAITFATSIKAEFPLSSEALDVLHKLDNIKFASGANTYTDKAIRMALDDHFGANYIARPGKTAKFIIVITDGAPSSVNPLPDLNKEAQSKGITILGVAIGQSLMTTNKERMLMIVGGKEENMFIADDFNALYKQIDNVMQAMLDA